MENNILDNLGISELNDMQKKMSEAFLHSGSDIVLLSPTGTGKTLAYLLPLVASVDKANDNVQAVVVVPGRELALQSVNVLRAMKCGVRGYACYGGRQTMDEHREIRKLMPQIIFATPGRLNDHIDKDNISIAHVRTVVIDEFDKCLDMGFSGEMMSLMTKLRFASRHVLLSATAVDTIPQYVNISNTRMIDYRTENNDLSDRIRIHVLRSVKKDKLDTLYACLCSIGSDSAVVFVNYRDSVERVADYLCEKGFVVSAFHGGLDQKEREAALYKFSNGSANIMVCTDLASRGLDINGIGHVIHYHLPETREACTHRNGRTARWDATGDVIFLLGPSETLPDYVISDDEMTLPDILPQPSKPRMATIYIGKGKKDKISRGDILGLICKKGGVDKDNVGKIDVKERYAYVAVSTDVVKQLLQKLRNEKIKGVKTVFELLR
ncbi:MAG: DEAD/DEAH box helicase [Prevotella sp.]|nr:DEAD/DEAH box helicase [Prevotella sp.]